MSVQPCRPRGDARQRNLTQARGTGLARVLEAARGGRSREALSTGAALLQRTHTRAEGSKASLSFLLCFLRQDAGGHERRSGLAACAL